MKYLYLLISLCLFACVSNSDNHQYANDVNVDIEVVTKVEYNLKLYLINGDTVRESVIIPSDKKLSIYAYQNIYYLVCTDKDVLAKGLEEWYARNPVVLFTGVNHFDIIKQKKHDK